MKVVIASLIPLLIVSAPQAAHAAEHETYRGYYIDLSDVTEQQASEIEPVLRHQVDIVESVGLSPRVLKFFLSVPILVDQLACLNAMTATDNSGDAKPLLSVGCYNELVSRDQWHTPTVESPARKDRTEFAVWDSATSQWVVSDRTRNEFDAQPGAQGSATVPANPILRGEARHGVVSVRYDIISNGQRPVVLHEMLHAFHKNVLPQGFDNPGILYFYKQAKGGGFYAHSDKYALTNEKEFFAVTGSVFLFGHDHGLDRNDIKKEQPEYYRYLGWLFGVNPERAVVVGAAQ
jgi:hypothetical protein